MYGKQQFRHACLEPIYPLVGVTYFMNDPLALLDFSVLSQDYFYNIETFSSQQYFV